MDKIKVLQFPIAQSRSGITHYAMRNWDYIDKTRFQFDFATLSKSLDFENELLSKGSKVHYISCYAEEDPVKFADEFRNILKNGYNAVHLHTGHWKSFAAEKTAVEEGVPIIIVHAHNSDVSITDPVLREEAIELHNRQKALFSVDMATHFFACAEAAANWLFGPQIPRDRIRVLKNAVNTETFAFDAASRAKYRNRLGISENEFVLGYVAKFNYQKNHEFLLDVFKLVHDRLKNTRLLLIGDGELQDDIKNRVNESGLGGKVIFAGRQPDSELPGLYNAMDVFCSTARFGGLDLVLVEAQTSGLACLTSDAMPHECGITDLFKFLPPDPFIWRDAVLKTAESGYPRRDRSGEVAAAGYSFKDQIKILESIYAGL